MMTTDWEGGRRLRTRRRPLIWLGVLLALAAAGAFWFRWQCWGVQTTHTVAELSGRERFPQQDSPSSAPRERASNTFTLLPTPNRAVKASSSGTR